MERLTKRLSNGNITKTSDPHSFVDVLNRLAAYEDTGLTPEQIEKANKVIVSAFNLAANSGPDMLIERLKEIIRAESEGRLLVLSGIKKHANDIRQMSDEELARYLTGVWWGFEETPGMCDVCNKVSIQNCSECWLDWLKQEAESDA